MFFKRKKKENWSVYLVRCADNSLYTGIAVNVAKRFNEHQTQSKKCAKFLRGKGPLQLVFQQVIGSHSAALKEEYRIKQLSKQQKEALLVLGVCPSLRA